LTDGRRPSSSTRRRPNNIT